MWRFCQIELILQIVLRLQELGRRAMMALANKMDGCCFYQRWLRLAAIRSEPV
jgi:hypothetical protein